MKEMKEMKEIKREEYLNSLIRKRENGLIKIITGIRRSGKSYLLDPIFKNYLKKMGIKDDHIIKIEFDKVDNIKYHDANILNEYLNSLIKDEDMYYVLLDEIQLVKGFEFVLNSLLYKRNVDVYVTGSNSKFLSTDIITEFRGRGDQIHINPLSYSEFAKAQDGENQNAWNDYVIYGGLPYILTLKEEKDKADYLKNLFDETYIKDIIERNNVKRVDILESLLNMLSSSVGSLINPQKLYKSFLSNGEKGISINTITSYLKYMEDAFLIRKVERYDVKGKKYISTTSKYYFSDIGLRNARLNFRQLEENHLMENIIYNELIYRGYNVDVGIVEIRDKDDKKQLEVDFVCNQGYKRYYIQSALNVATREKNEQESRPLNSIRDNFKKIIIVKEGLNHWYNEDGILIMNIEEFLLNRDSLDL